MGGKEGKKELGACCGGTGGGLGMGVLMGFGDGVGEKKDGGNRSGSCDGGGSEQD